MSYEINESKEFDASVEDVYQAAVGAVDGLGGKFVKRNDGDFQFEVKFDKKILGKVLGDRSWVQAKVGANAAGKTQLDIFAYPLNAVGQKLMFGARKGVLRTVLTWFYAHLDHRLPDA